MITSRTWLSYISSRNRIDNLIRFHSFKFQFGCTWIEMQGEGIYVHCNKAFNYVVFLSPIMLLIHFPAHKTLHGIWTIHKPILENPLSSLIRFWAHISVSSVLNVLLFHRPLVVIQKLISINKCVIFTSRHARSHYSHRYFMFLSLH